MYTIAELVNQEYETEKEKTLVNHLLKLYNEFSLLKDKLDDFSPHVAGMVALEVEIDNIPFHLLADSDLGKMGKRNIEAIERDFKISRESLEENIYQWQDVRECISEFTNLINE